MFNRREREIRVQPAAAAAAAHQQHDIGKQHNINIFINVSFCSVVLRFKVSF